MKLTEIMANKITTLKKNKFIVVQGELQSEKNGELLIHWVKSGKALAAT